MLKQTELPSSTPEAQGIDSASILAFVNAVEQTQLELHSLILVRHGHTIAKGWWSPYTAELPHMLFSLSKSFTSTAVGMAVAEGRLTVDDPVVDFFPADLPNEVSGNLAAMRVRDLLTMTTGHSTDPTRLVRSEPGSTWAQTFLAQPVERTPGTHFVYNSVATYMLSAIVQKLTGRTMLEYLTPRLFVPLGIEGATWENCPRGINTGGWGLKITSDDIAKFGQLYLQQGCWQGQQLITPEWVAAATSAQVPNGPSENIDWVQGYGYQFWQCRYGAYRGDGAFGQFCIVMPDQQVVIAITSGLRNMQNVLNLVWEHLLPAMQAEPLPADADAQRALADRLASLRLAAQSGAATSPIAERVSGQCYRFEENEQGISAIKFDFGQDGVRLTVHDRAGEHQLACGYQQWEAGETRLGQEPDAPLPYPVAASGAWSADDTYAMRLCFSETPFIPTMRFRFVEECLEFDQRYNVGFGPPEELEAPRLLGKKYRETG
ncbi:MAG: serine hydrolase [Caldilineaceae bacterium]|nr:serine hydrolase [Caldilineaceae bacterium]